MTIWSWRRRQGISPDSCRAFPRLTWCNSTNGTGGMGIWGGRYKTKLDSVGVAEGGGGAGGSPGGLWAAAEKLSLASAGKSVSDPIRWPNAAGGGGAVGDEHRRRDQRTNGASASTSQRGSATGSKGSAARAPVGGTAGGRCRGMKRAGSSQIKPLTVNSRADPSNTLRLCVLAGAEESSLQGAQAQRNHEREGTSLFLPCASAGDIWVYGAPPRHDG